ncbi:MAG: DNA repair protein RecO [Bacteroidota bacterium]
MLVKTRGIVFRSVKYSETSLICDIYTEELGLRTYIVSGVRAKKPKVSASLLQVMTLLDLVVYHRDNKDLNRTKEIKPALLYQSIPFDVLKSAVGLFMIELARKTIKESEPGPALFRFLFDCFTYLDTMEEGVANFHLYFAVHLTRFLGFMPGNDYIIGHSWFDLEAGVFKTRKPIHGYHLDEPMSELLHQLLTLSLEEIGDIPLNRKMRNDFIEKWLAYYSYHVENMTQIQAHTVLKEILG